MQEGSVSPEEDLLNLPGTVSGSRKGSPGWGSGRNVLACCSYRRVSREGGPLDHQRFLLSPSEWQGRPAAGDDSGLALTSPTPGHWPPSAARKLAGEWHSQAAANLKIRRQLPLTPLLSIAPQHTLVFFYAAAFFCFVFFEASRKVLLIDQLSKCRKSEMGDIIRKICGADLDQRQGPRQEGG